MPEKKTISPQGELDKLALISPIIQAYYRMTENASIEDKETLTTQLIISLTRESIRLNAAIVKFTLNKYAKDKPKKPLTHVWVLSDEYKEKYVFITRKATIKLAESKGYSLDNNDYEERILFVTDKGVTLVAELVPIEGLVN